MNVRRALTPASFRGTTVTWNFGRADHEASKEAEQARHYTSKGLGHLYVRQDLCHKAPIAQQKKEGGRMNGGRDGSL